jgi:hypothetical protein
MTPPFLNGKFTTQRQRCPETSPPGNTNILEGIQRLFSSGSRSFEIGEFIFSVEIALGAEYDRAKIKALPLP